MATRPAKIRDARTAPDFRDAVVERWRKIRGRRDPLPGFETPDQPPEARRDPSRDRRPYRSEEPRGFLLGRGRDVADDDDDE